MCRSITYGLGRQPRYTRSHAYWEEVYFCSQLESHRHRQEVAHTQIKPTKPYAQKRLLRRYIIQWRAAFPSLGQ